MLLILIAIQSDKVKLIKYNLIEIKLIILPKTYAYTSHSLIENQFKIESTFLKILIITKSARNISKKHQHILNELFIGISLVNKFSQYT